MKKIFSYISLCIILYITFHAFTFHRVNANDDFLNTNTQIIIPEASEINTISPESQNENIIAEESQNNTIQEENSFVTEEVSTVEENLSPLQTEEKYFVVTAYYSPLPGQKYYLKGNYQDEITLNGKGLRGASGKEVFPGMFAGPKSYPFGMKIELEGVGIGEIADRGGAIVSASGADSRGYAYDRIDIWMGHGEEGLARALAWGKRTVKGKIVSDSTAVNMNLSNFPAPESVLKKLISKPYIPKENNPKLALFDTYIGPESSSSNIKNLQLWFNEIGFSQGAPVDGKYLSVKNILINYQLKVGVIDKITDDGAGYFGPKTRAKAKQEYLAFLETQSQLADINRRKQEEFAILQVKIKKTVDKHISNIGSPKLGDNGKNVVQLQKTLKSLGYLNIQNTPYFGTKTKQGLIKYQLEKGIIKTPGDDGAGYFGPKTKEVMKTELITLLEKQVLKSKNIVSYKR